MNNSLAEIEIGDNEREQLGPLVDDLIKSAGIDGGWEKHVALMLTGVLLYVIYVAKAQGRTPHLHYAALAIDHPKRLFAEMARSPHPYVEYVAVGTGRIELRLRKQLISFAQLCLREYRAHRLSS